MVKVRSKTLSDTFPARSLSNMRSKADFRMLSAEAKTEELFGLISHLVPLSTQLADVVNALSARFHGMEDRKDIQHELGKVCFSLG